MTGFQKIQNRKSLQMFGILVAGILIGSFFFYLIQNTDSVSEKNVGQKVLSTVEAQTGQSHSLVNIEQENGLYKVEVKNSRNKLKTFYVTKDGSMITTQMQNLTSLRRKVTAQRAISNCLNNKNVVMFGNISQRETKAQIQVLGGSNFVKQFYADISRKGILSKAAKLGVKRIPAFYHNGSVIQGVQSLGRLSQFANCGLTN